MLFSSSKRDKVLGIDIGSASVKVLELSKSGRASVTAERYGSAPMPSGAVLDGKIKDIDMVVDSLLKAVKKSRSKVKQGAVCVSSSDIISKVISVESRMREDDLIGQIESEADRLVPYDLEEVSIDFINLGPSDQSPEEDDVQIVVCRKAVVEEMVDVLESADITPAIVDIDVHALARVHNYVRQGLQTKKGKKTQDDSPSGLIDFGAHATRFIVLQQGQIVYYRDTAFSGKQLTDGMRNKYSMSSDEAIYTLRKGDLPDNFKIEVLKPFVKSLIQETVRMLHFFYSSTAYDSISELMITGGCTQIRNLNTIIEKRLNIPTVLLDPFDSVSLGSRIDKKRFKMDVSTLGVSCGLALRGIK